MNQYLKELIEKYPLEIKKPQRGGGDAFIKQFNPIGGFPPIYLCDAIKDEEESSLKPRQYSTHKSAVSIKDILKKRRDVVPIL